MQLMRLCSSSTVLFTADASVNVNRLKPVGTVMKKYLAGWLTGALFSAC